MDAPLAEQPRANAADIPSVDRLLNQPALTPLSSQIGSGALPVDQLPSHGLAIRPIKGRRVSLDRLDGALRALPRPVIARIADKTLRLDLRCLEASEEADFVTQWSELRP